MSIEFVCYPKNADGLSARQQKSLIGDVLRALGYEESENIWRSASGTKHFFFREDQDYLSFYGVEANILGARAGQKRADPKSHWVIHLRTTEWASCFDRRKQNETAKAIRARFGGIFYNDRCGWNRYNPKEEDPRDAVARGLYLAAENTLNELSAVRYALPEQKRSNSPKTGRGKKIAQVIEQRHPYRALYNAVIPFAVAAFEHFFRAAFIILLKYERDALSILESDTRKVELKDVIGISRGDFTVEEVVARWFSFQNIDAIHSAYKKYLGVDFYAILGGVDNSSTSTRALLHEIKRVIAFRHNVVHQLDIDRDLSYDDACRIFTTVEEVIKAFLSNIEKKREIPIMDDTIFGDG